MNISRSQLEGIIKIYDSTKNEKLREENKSTKSKRDEVVLSPEYVKLSEAVNKLSLSSDGVRTQKIADIKSRIDSGTYSVDSRLVAEKMLKEILNRD